MIKSSPHLSLVSLNRVTEDFEVKMIGQLRGAYPLRSEFFCSTREKILNPELHSAGVHGLDAHNQRKASPFLTFSKIPSFRTSICFSRCSNWLTLLERLFHFFL